MSSEINHIKNYSAEDLRRYWNNEMTPAEMHALEIAAMDDPFLADALEGYAKLKKDPAEEIAILRQRLAERAKRAKVISLKNRKTGWKVAAAIIILVGVGAVTYRITTEKTSSATFAKNESTEKKRDGSLSNQQREGNASIPAPKTDSAVSSLAASKQPPSRNIHNQPGVFKKEQEKINFQKKDTSFSLGSISQSKDDAYARATAPKSVAISKAEEANKDLDKYKSKPYESAPDRKEGAVQDVASLNNFTGKVVDAKSNAIPFATIKMNNTNQSLTADQHGFFQFKSADSIANISIASTGYSSRNVILNSKQQSPRIILNSDERDLSEVVVKGKSANARQAQGNSDLKVYVMDAEPVTGWDEFNKYVDSNKRFPPNQLLQNGEVVVAFKVSAKGDLSAFNIEKSMGKWYDDEAIRLIRQGPAWRVTKGKKARVKVIVRY